MWTLDIQVNGEMTQRVRSIYARIAKLRYPLKTDLWLAVTFLPSWISSEKKQFANQCTMKYLNYKWLITSMAVQSPVFLGKKTAGLIYGVYVYIRIYIYIYVYITYVTLFYAILRFFTLHYVTLRYVTLRLRYVALRYFTLCYVTYQCIPLHTFTYHYMPLRSITHRYVTLN